MEVVTLRGFEPPRAWSAAAWEAAVSAVSPQVAKKSVVAIIPYLGSQLQAFYFLCNCGTICANATYCAKPPLMTATVTEHGRRRVALPPNASDAAYYGALDQSLYGAHLYMHDMAKANVAMLKFVAGVAGIGAIAQ
jgi:hypothetical protein